MLYTWFQGQTTTACLKNVLRLGKPLFQVTLLNITQFNPSTLIGFTERLLHAKPQVKLSI